MAPFQNVVSVSENYDRRKRRPNKPKPSKPDPNRTKLIGSGTPVGDSVPDHVAVTVPPAPSQARMLEMLAVAPEHAPRPLTVPLIWVEKIALYPVTPLALVPV